MKAVAPRSKFNVGSAAFRTVDGIVFDSKAEAARYRELLWLQRSGAISDLVLQPRFVLFPKAKHPREGTLRAIVYIADFQYRSLPSGALVVEDVKGVRMPVYVLKRSIFLRQHPDIDFKEIRP